MLAFSVAHNLSKRKADDNLMLLHTILYGKKAKVVLLKALSSMFRYGCLSWNFFLLSTYKSFVKICSAGTDG